MLSPVADTSVQIYPHHSESEAAVQGAALPASQPEIEARELLLGDAVSSGFLSPEEANVIRRSSAYSTSSPISTVLFGIIDIAIQSEANLSVNRNEMNALGFELSLEGNDSRFYASVVNLVFTVASAAASGAYGAGKFTTAKSNKSGDGSDSKSGSTDVKKNAASDVDKNGQNAVSDTFEDSSRSTFAMNIIFQLGNEAGQVIVSWLNHESDDNSSVVQMINDAIQNSQDIQSSTYMQQWL